MSKEEQRELALSTALTLRGLLQRLAGAESMTDMNIAAGMALEEGSHPTTNGTA